MCFSLKVKHRLNYKGGFPSIFTRMANCTSKFYDGKPTAQICPQLPPGVAKYREQWVRSKPIAVKNGLHQIVIRGKLDAVLAFDDGSFGIVDYKTSKASEEKSIFYQPQLSAYAYALENSDKGGLSLSPIKLLGLLFVTPTSYRAFSDSTSGFYNQTTWLEVGRNDAGFLELLDQIVEVLESPKLADSGAGCELCEFRREVSRFA